VVLRLVRDYRRVQHDPGGGVSLSGVLLPRMETVFGRGGWVANCILFALYHGHQPWGILDNILTGLLYPFPAYRYRSTWMSIILHSAQSGFFAFLVLGVVLGLA
jgi:membrane protease YdiL (CAAX protease family)